MKVQDLAPLILEILNSPNTDLDTISAKRVRKQLVELRSNVTVEFVKENMDELNALITKIFRSLKNTTSDSNNNGTSHVDSHDMAPSSMVNGKRKHGKDVEEDSERDNVHEDNGELSQSPTPPASKKAKKASHKLTDEEYARQLSSELNQRPSRSNRKSNGSLKKVSSRTPKKTKSRAKVDDSDDGSDDVDDHAKQRKSKSRTRKSNGEAKGGFAKELTLRCVISYVQGLRLSFSYKVSLWRQWWTQRSSRGHRLLKDYGFISKPMTCKILRIKKKYYAMIHYVPFSTQTRSTCSL